MRQLLQRGWKSSRMQFVGILLSLRNSATRRKRDTSEFKRTFVPPAKVVSIFISIHADMVNALTAMKGVSNR